MLGGGLDVESGSTEGPSERGLRKLISYRPVTPVLSSTGRPAKFESRTANAPTGAAYKDAFPLPSLGRNSPPPGIWMAPGCRSLDSDASSLGPFLPATSE